MVKVIQILFSTLGLGMFRLFKNRSVLKRGSSARSFRSRSFFFNRSVSLQIVPIVLRTRSMRSFFFRNGGIVRDRSVRSRERTIIPHKGRPALFLTVFLANFFLATENREFIVKIKYFLNRILFSLYLTILPKSC